MGTKMNLNCASRPVGYPRGELQGDSASQPSITAPSDFGLRIPDFLRISAFGFRISALLLLAGCGRDDVQVYRVAKETPSAEAAKLPAGWQAVAPGEMRVASFRVTGKDGKMADVGVVALPGMAGTDLDNVNRWRGQVSQPPVTKDDLA